MYLHYYNVSHLVSTYAFKVDSKSMAAYHLLQHYGFANPTSQKDLEEAKGGDLVYPQELGHSSKTITPCNPHSVCPPTYQ